MGYYYLDSEWFSFSFVMFMLMTVLCYKKTKFLKAEILAKELEQVTNTYHHFIVLGIIGLGRAFMLIFMTNLKDAEDKIQIFHSGKLIFLAVVYITVWILFFVFGLHS